MELSESKINEYMHRILAARTRLLCTNGFYGLLLMHMKFALDDTIDTAATDGEKTYFSPVFLNSISDKELDFVLMHEVLHVVLQHCSRYEGRDKFLFNIACDIVVNSNILHSNGMDEKSILVVADGAAFGPEMERLLSLQKAKDIVLASQEPEFVQRFQHAVFILFFATEGGNCHFGDL